MSPREVVRFQRGLWTPTLTISIIDLVKASKVWVCICSAFSNVFFFGRLAYVKMTSSEKKVLPSLVFVGFIVYWAFALIFYFDV